jgi:hypothetical protein
MFRKLLSLILAAFVVAGFSAAATAAPISGSLTLDLVIMPDCVGSNPAGNASVFGSLGPVVANGEDCSKVTGTWIKAEADLILTLSISGLDITSASTFTFKGLESEILRIVATVGALTVRTTLVFSSSITELEISRTTGSLSARYCVNYHSNYHGTSDITPPFTNCPGADSNLYFLVEDLGVYHPIIQNLALAYVFDNAGALDGPMYFMKKVVEFNLNIAGLVLGIRGLFANVGNGVTPVFASGLVLSLEGQTVSGITVRAETWFGARQGMECFAECKPNQRVYGGIPVSTFTVQEEKLFIRNLTVAGITHSIRAEFQFWNDTQTVGPGLTYLEWNQRFRVTPLGLSINNTMRFNGNLIPRYDFLITSYKVGDLTVTAVFVFYMYITGNFEAQLAEFIVSFDPPGVTVTSDLVLCLDNPATFGCTTSTGGVLEHDIYLSAAVGNFTFDAKFIFFGLINNFYEVWFDVTYQLAPGVTLANSYVIGVDALQAFSFSFTWKF